MLEKFSTLFQVGQRSKQNARKWRVSQISKHLGQPSMDDICKVSATVLHHLWFLLSGGIAWFVVVCISFHQVSIIFLCYFDGFWCAYRYFQVISNILHTCTYLVCLFSFWAFLACLYVILHILKIHPGFLMLLQVFETTLGKNIKDLTTCKTLRGIWCKD